MRAYNAVPYHVAQAVPAICAIHAANRRQSGDSEDPSKSPAGDTKEVPSSSGANVRDQPEEQSSESLLVFSLAASDVPLFAM